MKTATIQYQTFVMCLGQGVKTGCKKSKPVLNRYPKSGKTGKRFQTRYSKSRKTRNRF